jgi:hypothetical protein
VLIRKKKEDFNSAKIKGSYAEEYTVNKAKKEWT